MKWLFPICAVLFISTADIIGTALGGLWFPLAAVWVMGMFVVFILWGIKLFNKH